MPSPEQPTQGEAAQRTAEQACERLWSRDAASRGLGMAVLAVGPGYARISMTVRADMLNGHEICHGGYVFLLADSAFAFACNSYDRATVAASGSVEFLAPARLGERLTATAREVARARRAGLYDIEVVGEGERRIALLRGRSHELGGPVGASEP
jgi:acyl-CoA thioesterase